MNKQEHINYINRTVEQDMPRTQELIQLSELAIDHAKKCGATESSVSISIDKGLSLGVRQSDIETLEYTGDQGLGVTVFRGKRKGNASTADFSESAIRQVVEKACDIARFTQEDKYLGLADDERMASEFKPFDHWHPTSKQLTELIDIAKNCEQAGFDASAQISNSEGASLTAQSGLDLLATSQGFIGMKAGSGHSLSCVLVAGKNAEMQRDYWYDYGRTDQVFDEAEQIGRKAAQRTVDRLGARQAPTGQVPVLYSAEMARGLLGSLQSAVAGGNQYRKTSFLLDCIGKKVISDFISLHEQPFLDDGLRSSSYDSEGVATSDKYLVEKGILQNYLLGSYSARKLGLETTGNAGGLYNLSVESSQSSFEELLEQLGTGFYVTELMGQGVNMITGDYSRGASGFWVESGKITYPVQEVTIAGNLKEMLVDIQGVGNDIDMRSSTRTGSILLGSMMVAGS
ncbi:MAG: metalloprotease PmbA [bacterium]